MNMEHYALEDFILDETFQSYFHRLNDQDVAFWRQWIAAHPDKQDLVAQAEATLSQLMEIYKMQGEQFKPGNHAQIRTRLEENLQKGHTAPQRLQPGYASRAPVRRKRRGVYIILAVLLLLVPLGYYAYQTTQDNMAYVVHVTTTGERSEVTLSDGSHVLLNANSRLSYPKKFSDGSREITLEGEAFFSVAKDPSRPFHVTSGAIVTTALGTSFNVYTRDERVQVALVTGMVKVVHSEGSQQEVVLTPGEAAFYVPGTAIQKQPYQPKELLAWKEGVLLFNNDNIVQVVHKLEHWYGVEIEVLGREQSVRHFNGEFTNESLDNILSALSYSWGFTYTITGKKVVIKFKDS